MFSASMIMAVLLSYIQHLSYEILKYSVWYSWKNGHLSSGITTSWPTNQSDAKLLEGSVHINSYHQNKLFPCLETLTKVFMNRSRRGNRRHCDSFDLFAFWWWCQNWLRYVDDDVTIVCTLDRATLSICGASTWKVTSNLLDICFIHGDSHSRSCKTSD